MIKQVIIPVLFLYTIGMCACFAGSDMTGKEVFEKKCSYCHGPDENNPGTRQLALSRGKDKAILERRNDLTGEYIRYIVRHGLMSMPAFVPTDVSEQHLDDLIKYITSD